MTNSFPSWWTMVVVDVTMITIAVAATFFLLANRKLIKKASASIGAILMAAGLWVQATLYIADLYTMVIMPSIAGMDVSMQAMGRLHQAYSWYANSVSSLLLMAGLVLALQKLKHFQLLAQERRAEAERKELRLRTMFLSEPECVKTVDVSGRLLDMNPAGLSMVECDCIDQIRGQQVTDLLAPEYQSEFLDGVAKVFEGNRVRQQFQIIGLKGTRRWVDQTAAPLMDEIGGSKVIEMLAVTRDITDQVKMLDELKAEKHKAEAANHAKSEFLANMSHEIRTPLNGVLGMAEILKKKDLNDEQQECVETILDSGETLLCVVNDVLDISKIESGKMDTDPSPCQIRDALNRIVMLWRPKAVEKGLDLIICIENKVPQIVEVDQVRLRQCVSNLISNAIKFTSRGQIGVRVNCTQASHDNSLQLQIDITDTGIGISHEDQSRLFRPFEQVDQSMSRRFGGSGLGLAITRNLARLMGGDLTLESRPMEGSTFCLKIAAEHCKADTFEEEEANTKLDHGNSLSDKRVLIVDDNITNRAVARAMLAEHVGEIHEAENGEQALTLIEEKKNFDLIYLDMHMPVLDGPGMFSALRSRGDELWRQIPVIALTADAMYGDRAKYISMGMDGYVSKPVDQASLVGEAVRVMTNSVGNRLPFDT